MAAAKALQNPFEKKDETQPDKGEEKDAKREGDVEVELKDDEDDEDDEDEAASQGPSRKEKRRNRYAEQIQAKEEARREAEQLRQELAQLRQNQQHIVQAIQPQQQHGPEQELQRIREYKRAKAQEFNTLVQKGAMDADTEKRYWDELERVNDAEATALYQINQARDPRNDPAYQHNQQIISWLQSSHSDVWEHPRRDEIVFAARGKLMQMIAQRKGRMGDFASYERALSETKADFGLARRPANSSNGMQAKLAGVPRGGGAGEPARSMRLTKDEQKMAEARYRGIAKSPEQAYQMWAKDIQKQREKKARAGE